LIVRTWPDYSINRNAEIIGPKNSLGHEVDLILEKGEELYPVEIKSGSTVTQEMWSGLEHWLKLSDYKKGTLIYGGGINQKRSNGIELLPWNKVDDIWEKM